MQRGRVRTGANVRFGWKADMAELLPVSPNLGVEWEHQ